MPLSPDLDSWFDAQDYSLALDPEGRIIDFLDPEKVRPNTPEERIRQRTTQLLHFELAYPNNHLAIERIINIGASRGSADIVAFADADAQQANDQGRISFIGETKAPTIPAPDGQLTSYISATSAQGGFWTNGNQILFYRKVPGTGELMSWLGLPRFGFAWDSVGRFTKDDLVIPIDLKLAFRRCHNAIYRTGIDSEDVALDMVRVILSKIHDESDSSPECAFHITPDEYADPRLRSRACQRVRDLFAQVCDRYPDVFTPQELISASDEQLAIVIAHLQQYNFLEAPYDVIGTAYEVYVASHLKGERGQFFTNRLVINMMVRLLDPASEDIILDPACGSGGFLIAAFNYIYTKIEQSHRSRAAKDALKRTTINHLYGVDIAPRLIKIAKANMLLSKDGHMGIIRGNSLANLDDLPSTFVDAAGPGRPTIILTNPPFGSGYELRVKEPTILRHFASGHMWHLTENNDIVYDDRLNDRQGVAPELLFLERCIDWLKPGGTLGIVMAKGQLDNKEAFAVRRHVLETCQVLAVVNLHEDTFEPFCGSKASVIFLYKPLDNVPPNYNIFMAISNKVGQTSRGEPIFKRTPEGHYLIENGLYAVDEDLTTIAEDYHRFRKNALQESDFRFAILRSDLNPDTLSLNPIQYLPKHNDAVRYVLQLGDRSDFELHRLGDIARVYNGPRFKRPYADLGVTDGATIRKYFTGTALTQLNAENIKYLDSSKADPQTRKHLAALTIFKGYILVSDSGTLGRVSYALSIHDGHVATNNLIRVVIEDPYRRGYVYEFLRSPLGQSLMLKNAYGTNQEHLEPDVIAEIPVPIPREDSVVRAIGTKVLDGIEQLEHSLRSHAASRTALSRTLAPDQATSSQ